MSEMLGELHGGNPSEGAGRCKVGQDKSHDAKRVSDERSISVYSGILRPSDLRAEPPNSSYPMFIVASEIREGKFLTN